MTDKAVCFSGHRPEKLPGKGIDNNSETLIIKDILNRKIENCIASGYTSFLSGVARGIDLWAAENVIRLRESYPQIKLICVKPVRNQGYDFPFNDKILYRKIIGNADKVICTSEEYNKNCYLIRNQYLVDHSDMLIAFVKNYRSGTGQTINYARKLQKIIDITDLSVL